VRIGVCSDVHGRHDRLLAVLGAMAALSAARRRTAVPYEEAIAADTDSKSTTVFGVTGGGVVNTGDNSLASDFSREGIGAIDTDEVDPIAEAEVYLAYGRDAQAEEILKDALKKDPQRQEIYVKLLEIHAQHNKPSAFDAVAADLRNVSKGQGDNWQKAVALGRQLDPANPMFAAPVIAAVAANATDAVDAQRSPAPPGVAPARSHSPTSNNIFDQALEHDLAVSPAAKPELAHRGGASSPVATATAQLAGGLGKGSPGGQQVEKAPDNTFLADLDFRLDDNEKPAPLRSAPPPAGAATAGKASTGAGGDKFDLTFDDNASVFGDPSPSVVDGQWHDSATKLDLAKAYQEMGDVEGAREILREVLAEGDDAQKTEAGALIAKLG
jgi:pilus assembly protein FimV